MAAIVEKRIEPPDLRECAVPEIGIALVADENLKTAVTPLCRLGVEIAADYSGLLS